MAGYQFIHIETFAKVSSSNNKKQSARSIAEEAERDRGACPHVPNPEPPILVFGDMPHSIVTQAEELALTCKDPMGRKIRKDGQILLAGVASCPILSSDYEDRKEDFEYWLELNMQFLKKEYGEQLKGVLFHKDETWLHIHFYILPKPNEENHLHIRSVHAGMKERDKIGEKELKAGRRRADAYKSAMTAYQDRYYNIVSTPFGLTRDGPKRRRLTRKEWKLEQATQKRLAADLHKNKENIALISKAAYALESKDSRLTAKELAIDKKISEAELLLTKGKEAKKIIRASNKKILDIAEASSSGFFSKTGKLMSLVSEVKTDLAKSLSYWKSRALSSEAQLANALGYRSLLATERVRADREQARADKAEAKARSHHSINQVLIEQRKQLALLLRKGDFTSAAALLVRKETGMTKDS